MLAVLAAHQINRLLVAVPSKALRSQTAKKFICFGLLRALNVISPEIENPVVGIVLTRPRSIDDLALFRDCNVIVGTPSSLANGTATEYLPEMGKIVDTLIVDEAHHIAACTWSRLREAFTKKRVLQFTATPFRNDNKLVDGSVIYSYPLKSAQNDNYFTRINFRPVHEIDDEIADKAIASQAIGQLREDMDSNLDHLLMARCQTVNRANYIHGIYEELAPEFAPLLIYSDLKDSDQRIDSLHNRESRIVICVNMLGEGVDIPALKIAAIHDMHQSLAVLLQFIGRFTRKTNSDDLGEASVIANIADIQVSQSLELLYSQDADWNELLRELSSAAAKEPV
jgi:superfamily II DNA or RNA helicase